jgi:phage recombination protein Bet
MTQVLEPKSMNRNDDRAMQLRPQRQSALSAMADKFAVEPTRLMEVLKATVIKGTDRHTPSNEEVAAFIIVANQYGLNPFTREIHAFADSQRGVVPIVGIDGWSHIINSHDQFDGCEFEEVEDENGKPLKTTCIIHVKGRTHPTRVTERFSECKRNTGPWGQYPFRMLRHKALMQCARVAFSISGIYDEDEARDIIRNAASDTEFDRSSEPKRGASALADRLSTRGGVMSDSEAEQLIEQRAAETRARQQQQTETSPTTADASPAAQTTHAAKAQLPAESATIGGGASEAEDQPNQEPESPDEDGVFPKDYDDLVDVVSTRCGISMDDASKKLKTATAKPWDKLSQEGKSQWWSRFLAGKVSGLVPSN